MTPDDLRAQGLEFDPANGPQFYYERWCEALTRIEELSDALGGYAGLPDQCKAEKQRADDAEQALKTATQDAIDWERRHDEAEAENRSLLVRAGEIAGGYEADLDNMRRCLHDMEQAKLQCSIERDAEKQRADEAEAALARERKMRGEIVQNYTALSGDYGQLKNDLEANLAAAEAHEQQTHERLGAILGTDTSLEDGARLLKQRADEAEAALEKTHRPTIAQLLASEPADEALMESLREFGPERASYTDLYRVTKRLQANLAAAEAQVERQEQLLACYRLGKRPPGKLLDGIAKYKADRKQAP